MNSLLSLVKIVLASQHKRQPNKSLSGFVDNIEDTDSNLKVHRLHYANELLVRIRLAFQNFCKLAKQAETIRSYPGKGFDYD